MSEDCHGSESAPAEPPTVGWRRRTGPGAAVVSLRLNLRLTRSLRLAWPGRASARGSLAAAAACGGRGHAARGSTESGTG